MAFIEPMHCNEPNITYIREMRISSQVLLMLNTALFQPEIQTGDDDTLKNGIDYWPNNNVVIAQIDPLLIT